MKSVDEVATIKLEEDAEYQKGIVPANVIWIDGSAGSSCERYPASSRRTTLSESHVLSFSNERPATYTRYLAALDLVAKVAHYVIVGRDSCGRHGGRRC